MDEDSAHFLLSRGRLSGAQRDRIFERALEGARPRPARWPKALLAAALPVAAALVLHLASDRATGRGESGWLAPRGNGGVLIAAHCPGRPKGVCERGDRLIFELDGAESGGFFAAYAECEGRERVWYFPTHAAPMPLVPRGESHVIVERGARIGDEHGLGRCDVHMRLFDHPVAREEALAAGPDRTDDAVSALIVR